ncbi:MAG: flippase-like domain-containing protein [Bacteroidia bacterium]|nr:flippase-like domain-containing protein [Bacteroidia bacterium]MDW8346156.1 lysylphosphatidylglycerol synthase domain-containing protein [Bacteroidia bacterium]
MKIAVHNIRKLILRAIFGVSVLYIYHELRSLSSIWEIVAHIPKQKITKASLFLFILMIFNWMIEAKKWQYLAQKVLPNYTYLTSLQTVLCGITLGLFTPNRIGEYGARLFYVDSTQKADLFIFAFIDRVAQLWITIFIGMVFVFMYVNHVWSQHFHLFLGCFVVLFIVHLTVIFLRNKIIRFLVSRKKLQKYFTKKIFLCWKDVGVVLGYASVRYIIFVVQYLIWGYYTDDDYILKKGLIGVNTMLWIKSVVPSAGLSELGIRESVLMYVYKTYGLSTFTAFHSALVVYAVNLVIPSIVGLFLMPRMEFWRKKA